MRNKGAERRALGILYEDNHCLAAHKPAGMLTAGDRTGDVSLLELARQYLKEKYGKPGNVYLGLVHRLDRPVSGVVLLARTSKAAARLSAQFREGTVRKVYRAWVQGNMKQPSGEWTDWLLKEKETNRSKIVPRGTPGARQAALQFRTLTRTLTATHLELTPRTGRAHQIRVQLSARGFPILGDVKYGSRPLKLGRIALHAAQITFLHPVRQEPVTVRVPEPDEWKRWLGIR